MSSVVFKLSPAIGSEKCAGCGKQSDNGSFPLRFNGKPICLECIEKRFSDNITVATTEQVIVME